MGLIARLCMNCNGRGNVPALDAHGRDTGQNRDCSYCEGCGEVVAYTAHRGAVEREREILSELRMSGAQLDGERLAAWIQRRWPDFGGQ